MFPNLEECWGVPIFLRPVVAPKVCRRNFGVPANKTLGMLLGWWGQEGANDEVKLGEDEKEEQDLLHPGHPLHPNDGQGQDANQAGTPNQAHVVDP